MALKWRKVLLMSVPHRNGKRRDRMREDRSVLPPPQRTHVAEVPESVFFLRYLHVLCVAFARYVEEAWYHLRERSRHEVRFASK